MSLQIQALYSHCKSTAFLSYLQGGMCIIGRNSLYYTPMQRYRTKKTEAAVWQPLFLHLLYFLSLRGGFVPIS